MPAKLLVKPLNGERYAVDIGNTATIGRTPDNTVALSANEQTTQQKRHLLGRLLCPAFLPRRLCRPWRA
jgi:hypothetical protein